jgi:hypothetical protein
VPKATRDKGEEWCKNRRAKAGFFTAVEQVPGTDLAAFAATFTEGPCIEHEFDRAG